MNVSASNDASGNGSVSAVPSTSSTSAGQPAASLRQHLRALVEPDDRAAFLPEQLARDSAGSGRDVQHGVAGACVDARDEEAAPAWILAERECGGVAVVCRPERGEERPGGDGPCHRAEFMLAPCR